MRPIKLELQAFGTYLKNTVIDFENLNQYGIYLIFGPTGSGKTTIFDAIVFALYGEASGVVRDQKQFRSDFANKEIKTYVTFEFEMYGKKYKITRTPSYFIEGRKNPIQHDVTLYLPNGDLKEGVNDVSKEIENILNINAKQFRQIIMLAQGEFTKLIHSTTSEREIIFRKLFNTELFEEIAEELKNKNTELSSMLKEEKGIIESIISSIDNKEKIEGYKQVTTDLFCLPMFIDNLKLSENNINGEITKLAEKINEIEKEEKAVLQEKFIAEENNKKIKNYLNFKNELDSKLNQEEAINKLRLEIIICEEAKELEPLYTNYIQKEKELLILKQKYKSVQTELESLIIKYDKLIESSNVNENNKLELDNQKTGLKELREDQIIVENILEQEKILCKIKLSLKDLEEKVKNKEHEIKEKNNEIIQIDEKINLINSKKDEKFNLDSIIKDKNYELKTKKEIFEQIKNVEKKQNDIKKLVSEQTKAFEVNDKAYKKSMDLQQQYYGNLAGELAYRLTEGNECPVCGSLSHPKKAVLLTGFITKNDVESAQKELLDAQKWLGIVNSNIENTNVTINEILKDICEKVGKISIYIELEKESIDYDIKSIERELKELTAQVESISKFISDNKNINDNRKILMTSVEKLSKEKDLINKSITEKSQEFIRKESELDTKKTQRITQKLNVDFNQEIEKVNGKIKKLEKDIFEYENNIKQLSEQKIKHESSLEMLISQIGQKEYDTNNLDVQVKERMEKSNFLKSLELVNYYIQSSIKLNEMRKDVMKFDQDVAILKANISKVEAETKTFIEVDTQLIEKKIKVLTDERKNILEKTTSLSIISNKLKNAIEDLQKRFVVYKKIIEDKQDTDELCKIANGTNDQRLSFERYVLCDYFDSVLKHANLRFRRITNDRFNMSRKVEIGDARRSSGLDIEVFDSETGKRRDITSLSGGESFKAALSLALGLADTIESQNGGVEIDSLFIDEGFGTLDSESLDQAINTLVELRGDNKVIGIISHVASLKEIIDASIQVVRTSQGSEVKILIK